MHATDPSIVPKSPDAIIFSSFTPTMVYFLDTQPNDVAVRALELRWNFEVRFQHFQQIVKPPYPALSYKLLTCLKTNKYD